MARRNRISYRPAPRRRRKCRCGKTVFVSDVDAKNFLATRELDAVPLRSYFDNGCGAWHLTGQPREQVRTAR